MRSFSSLLIKSFVFLLLTIVLQSCHDKAGSWKNEQIKPGKRGDFHELNNQALKYLKTNDPKDLSTLMSKELIDNTYTQRLIELISNQLNDNNYTILDEYYVVNKYIDNDTVNATGNGLNSYSLKYPGTAREMYMAFFVPNVSENKYMISLIYAKYNYGWKLSELDLSPYTINGKTGPELFELAKEEYNKKYLVDAVNNMALAVTCLKPCDVWQYPVEQDAHAFYDKVITEANTQFTFPITLSQLPSKPLIIRVYNETNGMGYYPMVYYLSKIRLKDTVAIKNENAQIKRTIGEIMPGIDKDKKYVFYSAFNEKPTGRKVVDHFDMTDTLKAGTK